MRVGGDVHRKKPARCPVRSLRLPVRGTRDLAISLVGVFWFYLRGVSVFLIMPHSSCTNGELFRGYRCKGVMQVPIS